MTDSAAPESAPLISLSRRQRQVLGLLAEGMTNTEIARELAISPRTARMHCDCLRMKLAVPKRRLIPAFYRRLTGEDPHAQRSSLRSRPI